MGEQSASAAKTALLLTVMCTVMGKPSSPDARGAALQNTSFSNDHSHPWPANVTAIPGNQTIDDDSDRNGEEYDSETSGLLPKMAENKEDSSSQDADTDNFATYRLIGQEDIMKVTKDLLSRSDKIVTEDHLHRSLRIMEDLDRYSQRIQRFGDIKNTVRALCETDVAVVVEGALYIAGGEQGLLPVLAVIAMLQLHDCPKAALNISIDLTTRLTEYNNKQIKEEAQETVPSSRDHCEAVAECRHKVITTVRQVLGRVSSLRVLYDIVASAIFTTSRSLVVADVLLNGVLDDLNITGPGFSGETSLRASVGDHAVIKRGGCNDPIEQKIDRVIDKFDFVPYIDTVYSWGAAVVYAGRGCFRKALEKLEKGAVSLIASSLGPTKLVAKGALTILKTIGETNERAKKIHHTITHPITSFLDWLKDGR